MVANHTYTLRKNPNRIAVGFALAMIAALLAGCPPIPTEPLAADALPANQIELIQGRPTKYPPMSLNLELMALEDSRCPEGRQCVWEGHAIAMVQVSRDGVPPAALVIGTAPSAGVEVQTDAQYDGLRLHLISLNAAVAKGDLNRVVVQISKWQD